ncbi:MAG: hypothetical protein ACHQCF_02130 [Solirubrobacterales bacterium]
MPQVHIRAVPQLDQLWRNQPLYLMIARVIDVEEGRGSICWQAFQPLAQRQG